MWIYSNVSDHWIKLIPEPEFFRQKPNYTIALCWLCAWSSNELNWSVWLSLRYNLILSVLMEKNKVTFFRAHCWFSWLERELKLHTVATMNEWLERKKCGSENKPSEANQHTIVKTLTRTVEFSLHTHTLTERNKEYPAHKQNPHKFYSQCLVKQPFPPDGSRV